ncbi:MAG TPA: recombinase family protein [Gemmataceae bacterium]|jgi:DNA invertase Pin-like site-specific DNA recombinase
MKTEQLVNVLIAYSYIRFSTPEQAKGDSLRRQGEMAVAFCQRRGWTLSTATYRDLGVSARHGKNALVGNLGQFLKAVESGAVKPGSALIVESLDRITRQGIDEGYDLIKKILKAGILLVTLSPEREFDVSATKSLSKGALEIQLILERAAEESERKSERIGKAWREKKRRAAQNREPLTARTPSWLRLVDGELVVDDQAKTAIQRIFHLVTDGYGIGVITKKFNADKVPVISSGKRDGKHWARSYVAKILNNRAVVGEYQPYKGRAGERETDGDPIPGYYPEIISEEEWYAAKGALAARKGKAGRPAKHHVNVFSGLLHDARSGGTMQIMNKGKLSGGIILVPYNAVQGVKGSVMASFPFPTFERAVLKCLREVKPSDILPRPKRGKDKTTALNDQLLGVLAEIEKLKARLLVRYSDAVADVLERREDERCRLTKELSTAQQEAAAPIEEAWKNCHTLIDALKAAPDEEEARIRLRAALRRIVEGIWCVFVPHGRIRLGEVQVMFKDGPRRDYLVLHRPATGGAVGERPARWYVHSLRIEKPRKFGPDDQLDLFDIGDLRDPLIREHRIRQLESLPQDVINKLLMKGQPIE